MGNFIVCKWSWYINDIVFIDIISMKLVRSFCVSGAQEPFGRSNLVSMQNNVCIQYNICMYVLEHIQYMFFSLSLQEYYGPWMFWHLQPIGTMPRMPVLSLHCAPFILDIFRLQLSPLLQDLSHLSEVWHMGRLQQSLIGRVCSIT